jgi:predicted metal-dependent phosphoesterase TrpH
MKKYDLHIHSYCSPCSVNKPADILKCAKKASLDGIAITDHGTTKGALQVKKLNKDAQFEVIIGEEIRTDCGDLLALYVQEEIKHTELFSVLEEIKAQDALAVIAHPFRFVPWLKFSYPMAKIKDSISAVEVFNSRNFSYSNVKAMKIADALHIAKVGSSDAHFPFDIGKGYTIFEGNLRKAIKDKRTDAKGTTQYAIFSGVLASAHKYLISPFKVKKCP